ncbi:hypothetical protein MBLNU230_g0419t1 [Neophaeotheca triangularis]
MALANLLEGVNTSTIPTVALLALASLLSYRAFLHPLRDVPGPFICRLTSLWIWYRSFIGDECSLIVKLHDQYGPFVRIGPDEVVISDGAALQPVYNDNGGFLKAPCYSNFDSEGHSTVFSTTDPKHRSARSKAVASLFSMSNVRAKIHLIEGSVDRMVEGLKSEKEGSLKASQERGKPVAVNLLNLTRSLAIDATSSFLFGVQYDGTDGNLDRLNVSAYIDFIVTLGRTFFTTPHWVPMVVDMVLTKLYPNTEFESSAQKVDSFADSLVKNSGKDDATYQARLLKAGISPHETKVQLQDLIFAGTDNTGTNLASLCWRLTKHPDMYKRLRAELEEAESKNSSSANFHDLPYLNAIVREGLRTSMANPTRLPRVVPQGGWTFTSHANNRTYHLPGGCQVGLQLRTLHFNPVVFPDPFTFKPERWLGDVSHAMQRDAIPFGMGSRQCIARNLALTELLLAVRAIAREGVLEGAKAVGDRIEMKEWFSSQVVGRKVELVWS